MIASLTSRAGARFASRESHRSGDAPARAGRARDHFSRIKIPLPRAHRDDERPLPRQESAQATLATHHRLLPGETEDEAELEKEFGPYRPYYTEVEISRVVLPAEARALIMKQLAR